jgi:hypothetical protein
MSQHGSSAKISRKLVEIVGIELNKNTVRRAETKKCQFETEMQMETLRLRTVTFTRLVKREKSASIPVKSCSRRYITRSGYDVILAETRCAFSQMLMRTLNRVMLHAIADDVVISSLGAIKRTETNSDAGS